MRITFRSALILAGVALAWSVPVSAQIQNASGQNVLPVFEGWERNTDGSFNMVFGYMNRNYEEQLDIAIGPDNNLSPGIPDQGQPTHFYRRRQQFVFKVRVPKDWGQKDLVWTLKSRDRIEKAHGKLLPIWELGNLVYQENRGGLGVMTWPEEPNDPPSIEMVGPSQVTVTLPETLALTVDVSDDGYPKPRTRRAGSANVVRDSDGAVIAGGRSASELVEPMKESPLTQAVVKLDPGVRLGVTWVLYRGPAPVAFDPPHVAIAKLPPPGVEAKVERLEGKAATKVTFREPGVYRLRCYADDSVLVSPIDVLVTVLPPKN